MANAVNTLSALGTSLKIGYSPEYMEAQTNFNAPLLKKFETLKKLPQNGKSFDWEFPFNTPQVLGSPGDGGAVPTKRARVSVAGTVNVGTFSGGFDITAIAEAVGTESGSFNGTTIKRASREAIDDVTKHQNRIYAGTHGTGRLAQVEATTDTLTTFVGKLPLGVLLLRKNMSIQIYNSDDAIGTERGTGPFTISKIVASTRTVTIPTAITVTADDHVYLAGDYTSAKIPNGLRGLVDDGTNLTTLHGVSRATYEEMKSVVLSNSGTKRDLTEDLLVDLAHGVRQKSGRSINLLTMNWGQLAKYLKFVRADRRFNVNGSGVIKGDTGYKDLPTFYLAGSNVEILPSEDVAPREIYGLDTTQIRRIVARKLDWYEPNGSMFQQTITTGGGGYSFSKEANLLALENLATYMPGAHGRIEDLNDKQLCGSSVGGSDL